MYVGSYGIDDALTFYAETTRVDTGAATDGDSAPTYRVYEDETGTPLLTGSMALLDSSNTAGFYSEQITLSAANGFELGKCYAIYISATVNSIVGASYRQFQVGAKVNVTHAAGTAWGSGAITAASIAADAITAAKIADNAIDAGAIAADAITSAKIADNAITANKIANDAITAAKIATGAIDADAIADNAIDAGAIAADAITSAKIADNAITAAKVADGAIDAATFAAGAINAAAIAADAITAAKLAADVTTELQNGLATAAALSTAQTAIDAILDDTGTAGVVVAAASKTGYRLSATGVDDGADEVYEDSLTLRQIIRILLASAAGKLSGAATTTVAIRDAADSKDRITATVDANGNRSAVTLDGT